MAESIIGQCGHNLYCIDGEGCIRGGSPGPTWHLKPEVFWSSPVEDPEWAVENGGMVLGPRLMMVDDGGPVFHVFPGKDQENKSDGEDGNR